MEEALITEKTFETLLERGLMPLISFKDQDQIRLARFQSLAADLQPLAGRWSES